MKIDLLHNQDNESPTSFAQRLGDQYMSMISNGSKKEKGQFFTPIEIARFMSEQLSTKLSSTEFCSITTSEGRR